MSRRSRNDWIRWSIAAAILAITFLFLSNLEDKAREATAAAAVDRLVLDLEDAIRKARPHESEPFPALLYIGNEEGRKIESAVRARVAASPVLVLRNSGRPLHFLYEPQEGGRAKVGFAYDEFSIAPAIVWHTGDPISVWSALPPILALVLAFATGKLVLSLGLAVVVGAVISQGPNPAAFVPHALVEYGWKATFSDPFKLWIFTFTTLLIGMVAVVTRAGGVQGVVQRLAKVAKGRRSVQAVTWLMGVAIFFDDYANTILVGSTMKPLADKARISREKLSYLVDSTSAPVAGIAVISTWIGYEVGLLGDLSKGLGLGLDGYGMFFAALPFRFYCMFTLIFGGLVVFSGRDFGPMLKAERRAWETGEVSRKGARPLSSGSFQSAEAKAGVPHRAHVAVIPIAVVLGTVLVGFLLDGGALGTVASSPLSLLSWKLWRDAFGAAENSTFVLAMATIAGSVVAFGLVLGQRLLGPGESLSTFVKGMRSMGLAIAILTLAWAIKATCDDLGTQHFLVSGLRDVVHPTALPLLIFFLASVVALATGTSWGTMGILIPTAAPLAFHLGGMEVMFLSLAAVLDGAIFGDHISPISDTTVMSSIASGADHLDHVKTQLPYATVAMGAAAIFGYGWNAMGLPYGWSWVLGPGLMAAVVFGLGRRVVELRRARDVVAPADI